MKKRNRIALSLLSLCLLSAASPAATYHGGTISADETWTLAGSPHIINSSLRVEAKVTVEAGVTVEMHTYVLVLPPGSIVAVGSPYKPIEFKGNQYDVSIESDVVSEFRYCHFQNLLEIALWPIWADPDPIPSASHLFQHCLFLGGINSAGVIISLSPSRILNCTFLNNRRGAICVYMSFMTANAIPTIRNNTIIGPGIAILEDGNCWNEPFIQDNHVTGPYGIRLDGPAIEGLLVKNCSFNCVTGIVNESASHIDLTLEGCDLTSVAGVLPSGTFVLINNWWGTTNSTEIDTRIFGGALDESAFMPCATNSCFQQADVDGSAAGNATGQEDATMVKEHIVGLRQLTPEQQAIADVDHDNDVDLRDALMIESFVKGTLWRLPSP
ncbi:MAG: hypothetical protein PHR35_05480 [Kiritimatiellae bacterium]|nr:hypothetical protein [Kiritimatiellia bacterium]